MHTFLTRIQRASGKFSTALSIAALAVAILAWIQLWHDGLYSLRGSVDNVEARMSVRTTRRFGGSKGHPKENVRVSFDLDADLTPLFNWNTKQVFTYLTLDYTGSGDRRDTVSNTVTVWDKILLNPSQANLHLHGERSKYSVWDIENTFGDRNASLTLRWSVQPRVGFMLQGSAPAGSLEFSGAGKSV